MRVLFERKIEDFQPVHNFFIKMKKLVPGKHKNMKLHLSYEASVFMNLRNKSVDFYALQADKNLHLLLLRKVSPRGFCFAWGRQKPRRKFLIFTFSLTVGRARSAAPLRLHCEACFEA